MKTSRTLVLIAVVLICGFFAACWCAAQSARQTPSKDATTDSAIALRQLELLVTHLHETKQTNTLRLFNDYSNALEAQQNANNVAVNLRILMGLREGRTNEAIDWLEMRLTSDFVACIARYQELPPNLRDKFRLTILHEARDYFRKYRVNSEYPDVNEYREKALTVLDGKVSK
jgi:hypothetical protein